MPHLRPVDAQPVLPVLNPYSGKVIDEVVVENWDAADRWLEAATRLHRNRANWKPAHERIAILKRAASIMRNRFEPLAFQIANEGGKPLIDARVEVDRAINGIDICVSELLGMRGTEIPMDLTPGGAGRLAFTAHEPIGPVVAVSAFNHPLNLIVHQVAPAVAAGCPVIVKPADDTPLSARSFIGILHEAGLEEEWCRLFVCDIPTAERLVTDGRVAFFSFIGSARVGWALRSKLAPGTRCALEHGGAAPVIVDDTADIESLIPALAKGAFYHAGQVCVSVQRIFVNARKVDEVASLLAEAAASLRVGDATRESTDVGPLIRAKEVDRVAEWVAEAKLGGAQVLAGGETRGPTAYAPTVLLNPPAACRVSREEVFGPVVAVFSYDHLNEALSAANALPYAFQAACFTQSLKTATTCIEQLDASAVMVNDHSAFRVDWMPFAGRRQSGYGVGGIGYTMRDMMQEKMAVIRT